MGRNIQLQQFQNEERPSYRAIKLHIHRGFYYEGLFIYIFLMHTPGEPCPRSRLTEVQQASTILFGIPNTVLCLQGILTTESKLITKSQLQWRKPPALGCPSIETYQA